MNTVLHIRECPSLAAHKATTAIVAKQKCLAFHKWGGYISHMLTNSDTYTAT
jgi:hypothetical protein